MFDWLYGAIGFIVMIMVVAGLHEWGHFMVARSLGFKILKFSIGMGRSFFRWKTKDGVECCLAILPLGGYVKFLDESEMSESDRLAYSTEDLEGAFNRQSVWKRAAVVVAGPLANFILGIIAFSIIAFVGFHSPKAIVDGTRHGSWAAQYFDANDTIIAIDGEQTETWQKVVFALIKHTKDRGVPVKVQNQSGEIKQILIDLTSFDLTRNTALITDLGFIPRHLARARTISSLSHEGAGYLSGLREGDKFISIQGKSIQGWQDVVALVSASPGHVLDAVISRSGAEVSLKLAPQAYVLENGQTVGLLNISTEPIVDEDWVHQSENLPGAIAVGVSETGRWSLLIWATIKKLINGDIAIENIGGPLMMADGAGQAVKAGWLAYIMFLGVISVNLGVMNLLPIPALDGGHLCTFAIEAARRKPFSIRTLKWAQWTGGALLVGLMVFVVIQDFYFFIFT